MPQIQHALLMEMPCWAQQLDQQGHASQQQQQPQSLPPKEPQPQLEKEQAQHVPLKLMAFLPQEQVNNCNEQKPHREHHQQPSRQGTETLRHANILQQRQMKPEVPGRVVPSVNQKMRSEGGHDQLHDGVTLMLRNIPVTFDRQTLMADFDSRGFRGAYDFFYLPIDFQTGNNLGYAFVNVSEFKEARRFRSVYQGLALAADRSKKVCAVADATTQGRAANVDYYRNSPVMRMEEKYHPIVLRNGVPEPFPAPTKTVKAMRLRSRKLPRE